MGSSSSKHISGPNSPYFLNPNTDPWRPPGFWTKWNEERYEEDYARGYSGGHGRRHNNQANHGRGGNYSVTPRPPWFSKVAFDRGTKLDPFPGENQGHGHGHGHGGGKDSRRDGLGGRPQDGRHHGGGHHHHHGGERHGGRHHSRHRHHEGEHHGGRHHSRHRHHEGEYHGGRHHGEHHQAEFPDNRMIEFDTPRDAEWKQEHGYDADAGAFNSYYGPKYHPGIRK